MRIPRGTSAETVWRRFNGSRALVWIAVTILALLFGWIYSVAFVAACSLYANIASDVAAWRSDINPSIDELAECIARLEEKIDRLLNAA